MFCIFNFRFINFRFNFLLKIEALLLSAEKDLPLSKLNQSIFDMLSKYFNLMIKDLIDIYINHYNNLIKYSFI